MALKIRCPKCDELLYVPDRRAGSSGPCPGCGHRLVFGSKPEAAEDDDAAAAKRVDPSAVTQPLPDFEPVPPRTPDPPLQEAATPKSAVLIVFPCQTCGKNYKLRNVSFAGKRMKCKQCGAIMTVPAPGTPAKKLAADEPRARPRIASHPAATPIVSTGRYEPPEVERPEAEVEAHATWESAFDLPAPARTSEAAGAEVPAPQSLPDAELAESAPGLASSHDHDHDTQPVDLLSGDDLQEVSTGEMVPFRGAAAPAPAAENDVVGPTGATATSDDDDIESEETAPVDLAGPSAPTDPAEPGTPDDTNVAANFVAPVTGEPVAGDSTADDESEETAIVNVDPSAETAVAPGPLPPLKGARDDKKPADGTAVF